MKGRTVKEEIPPIYVADETSLKVVDQYRREYLINTPAYKLECLK